MWRAARLEEPNAKGTHGQREAAEVLAATEVDNIEAGGFFARFGRERDGPRTPAAGSGAPPPEPMTIDSDSDV
jgi:hypothetical protein